MITVEIEGDFLNFMRDGHVFYDPVIPAQSGDWEIFPSYG